MLTLASEKDTVALGAALAADARRGDVIALRGPLGAGKTTLARGFIQKIVGTAEEVVSPTFTLVQVYDTADVPIWHFDLYRLDNPEDAWELGFEEALATGISVIEWPERLGALLPAARLDVVLSSKGDKRQAELSGWPDRLAALRNVGT
jgi:tRNA threonylcarbamoyladenosine biosynthesis protein TsaE